MELFFGKSPMFKYSIIPMGLCVFTVSLTCSPAEWTPVCLVWQNSFERYFPCELEVI